MKMSGILVTLAVVLVVIGAGLSYVGYNESLQSVTQTSIRSFTVTSMTTEASTVTESIVITTSSTDWILQDEIFDLQAPGQAYCGYWSSANATLEAGEVHVSYSTDGRPVEFWMLSPGDYVKWKAVKTCQNAWNYHGIVSKSSKAEDLTVSVPSDGLYYFVFMNTNKYDAIVVTLNVDAGIKQNEYTVTNEHTVYSTGQAIFPTQTVTTSVQPGVVGSLLYLGIALIVVAVVVLAIGMRSGVSLSRAPAPPATSVATLAPAVSPASAPVARKFCINCGAPLPIQMVFCNKCGTKQ